MTSELTNLLDTEQKLSEFYQPAVWFRCRRKQQSKRDEYGEALLDTERGEMVRSQRGTVA